MEGPENSGSVNDHHRHGSSRGDVPGIVHVEDGNRCEHGFRRVEEDHGGNGGHGVEEEVTAHVQQGRETDGQRDLTDGGLVRAIWLLTQPTGGLIARSPVTAGRRRTLPDPEGCPDCCQPR